MPITETASANGLNSLVRSIGTSTSSAAVAAVLTSVTITVGTAHLPSFDAFKDVFWMAALASAGSILAAVFIPRLAAPRPAAPGGAVSELVVQGRVLAADHRPLTPAVVTVLQTDGEPVDWSRVDSGRQLFRGAARAPANTSMVANAARLGADGGGLRLRRPHPAAELPPAGPPGAQRRGQRWRPHVSPAPW